MLYYSYFTNSFSPQNNPIRVLNYSQYADEKLMPRESKAQGSEILAQRSEILRITLHL